MEVDPSQRIPCPSYLLDEFNKYRGDLSLGPFPSTISTGSSSRMRPSLSQPSPDSTEPALHRRARLTMPMAVTLGRRISQLISIPSPDQRALCSYPRRSSLHRMWGHGGRLVTGNSEFIHTELSTRSSGVRLVHFRQHCNVFPQECNYF